MHSYVGSLCASERKAWKPITLLERLCGYVAFLENKILDLDPNNANVQFVSYYSVNIIKEPRPVTLGVVSYV